MEILSDQTNCFWRSTAADDRFFWKGPCRTSYERDPNITGFPAITMILIAANTILFFATPGDMVDRLCSLPLDEFGLPHLILATAASAFLHPDIGHLLMNMLLLGIFGVLLEPRLTPGLYLAAVLLGSVLSSLISLNLLVSQVNLFDASINLFRCTPAGTSGAIAGLMGLCVLRCSVIWRSVSRSMWGHLLFFFLLLISATVLIGIFFFSDFVGNAVPTHDMTGTADRWGHVGAFLGGLVLGLVFTLIDYDLVQWREDVAGGRL